MISSLILIKEIFDLQEAKFEKIEHEDAIIAIIYKVIPLKGEQVILKIFTKPNDYAREEFFLTHLQNSLPIPKIIQSIPPAENTPGAILMEFLHGDLLKPKDWSAPLAFEIGRVLATLHKHPADGYGDVIKNETLNPSATDYFEHKLEEELQESRRGISEKTFEKCRSYFTSHKYLLKTVNGPRLIHRDFRPGNLMVHQGKLQGIIDWSLGRAGFTEQDFWFLSRPDWAPKNPKHLEAFLSGYASVRKVPDYKKIMPLLELGRALAVIGYCLKSDTWEDKNRLIYEYHIDFIKQFQFD